VGHLDLECFYCRTLGSPCPMLSLASGFILASGFENTSMVKELLKKKVPTAVIAREMPQIEVDTVSIDNFLGGYLATSHLVGLGHKKIAIIARDLWSNRERMRGYRQALLEADLSFGKDVEYVTASTVDSGRELAEKLLDSTDPPTAIFACNDLLAIGAIQAAKQLGFRVPQDVSVVGFDNTVWASVSDPPLTTVSQPFREMGREVMDLLVQEIEGKKKGKKRIVLLPELIVRQSTTQPNQ
ncbi:substrate-binding domain-containing protein, partial [Brevibacillus thermoruber]